MNYLTFTIIVFVLAALGGIFMIAKVLSDKRPPRAVAYIHGILGATAYGVFLFYSFGAQSGLITGITIFLTIAVLGGLALFSIDTIKKKVPKAGAILHATAAITGVILLLVYALGN